MSRENLFTGLNGTSDGLRAGHSEFVYGKDRFVDMDVDNPGGATIVMHRSRVQGPGYPDPEYGQLEGPSVEHAIQKLVYLKAGFKYRLVITSTVPDGKRVTASLGDTATGAGAPSQGEMLIASLQSGTTSAGVAPDTTQQLVAGGAFEGLMTTSALLYIVNEQDADLAKRFNGAYRPDGLDSVLIDPYDEGVTLDHILTGTDPTVPDTGGDGGGDSGGGDNGGGDTGPDTSLHISQDLAVAQSTEPGNELQWTQSHQGITGFTGIGSIRSVEVANGGAALPAKAYFPVTARDNPRHMWLRVNAQFANSELSVQSAGNQYTNKRLRISETGAWHWAYAGFHAAYAEQLQLWAHTKDVAVDRVYFVPNGDNYLPGGSDGRSGEIGIIPPINTGGGGGGGTSNPPAQDGTITSYSFDVIDLAGEFLYAEQGSGTDPLQTITIDDAQPGHTGAGYLKVNTEAFGNQQAKAFMKDVVATTQPRAVFVRYWAAVSGSFDYKSSQGALKNHSVNSTNGAWVWVRFVDPIHLAYDRQIMIKITSPNIFIDKVILADRQIPDTPSGENGFIPPA